jgi:hypothetical protein
VAFQCAHKVAPVSLGRVAIIAVALAGCSKSPDACERQPALAGCSKSPDACERLAARLMPSPDATFIETCRAESAHDPSYARMVGCVLAIQGGVTEANLKTCPGSDRLLFFQF